MLYRAPVVRRLGAGKVGSDGRPMTSAVHQPTAAAGPASRLGAITADSPPSSGAAGGPSPAMPGLVGRELKMVILATWGDPYYMGLTGLEVLGPRGQPLPLTRASLDACPRDLNAIPGYLGDDRTLDKLLDGVAALVVPACRALLPRPFIRPKSCVA